MLSDLVSSLLPLCLLLRELFNEHLAFHLFLLFEVFLSLFHLSQSGLNAAFSVGQDLA